jgi:ketosteroid isomerase-like protein
MAHNPNLAVIERFVGAVFSGDGEALKALCAPDFQLHEGSGLAFAGTYHGGEGFLRFLEIFGATFDIERLEPLRTYVTDDPDYVVAEMDLRAVVKATGKVFASSLLERWRFRDGQVIEIAPHYFHAM